MNLTCETKFKYVAIMKYLTPKVICCHTYRSPWLRVLVVTMAPKVFISLLPRAFFYFCNLEQSLEDSSFLHKYEILFLTFALHAANA